MKGNRNRCGNLLSLLLKLDSGDYFDKNENIKKNSGIDYRKTKTFRLIPKNDVNNSDDLRDNAQLPRYYSIDGERYPIEPIQVNTYKKGLKVFFLMK
jgi:hypothetical protein